MQRRFPLPLERTPESMDRKEIMTKRKSGVIRGVFVILLGLAPLLNSLDNPRLAAAHGVDYVRLIAVGLCFGIGLSLLVGSLRSSGE